MVIFTYSQEKMKVRYKEKISKIFNLVKTMATPDLWIKVFFFNQKRFEYWGLNWDKDGEQIKFFFGDRFSFEDVSKKSIWDTNKYAGHYRCRGMHGFYDEEWNFLRQHPNIQHVITLKITDGECDEVIANLIAHEYRHYMQYKKYGERMISRGNNGRKSRPIQVERDANKWAEKRVKELIQKGLI